VAPASGVDDDSEATLEFRVVCRDNLGGGVCSSSGLGLDGPAVTALHGRPSGVAAAVGSGVVPALAECQALSTLRDRSSVGQEGQAVVAAAVAAAAAGSGVVPALAECQALSTLRDRSSVGQEGQAVVAAAVGSGVVPALAECQAPSTPRNRSSVGQEGQAVAAAAAVDSVGVERGPPPLDGPPSPPPRVPSTLSVSPPVAAGEPDEGARRMLVGSGPVKTCGEVRLESPKSSNNAEDVAGTGTSDDDDDDDDGENLRRVRE